MDISDYWNWRFCECISCRDVVAFTKHNFGIASNQDKNAHSERGRRRGTRSSRSVYFHHYFTTHRYLTCWFHGQLGRVTRSAVSLLPTQGEQEKVLNFLGDEPLNFWQRDECPNHWMDPVYFIQRVRLAILSKLGSDGVIIFPLPPGRFCKRACLPGPEAKRFCQHIYVSLNPLHLASYFSWWIVVKVRTKCPRRLIYM